jgi:hypothetical protein
MRWISATVQKVCAVFLDDERFAAAVLVWIILICVFFALVPEWRAVGGVLLIAGLVATVAQRFMGHGGR